jgi:integrative and conjugative element protein (TIGR02256 family)
MTPGQELALEQLRDIAGHSSGLFEILSNATTAAGALRVDISISCRHFHRRPEGLQYRARERFVVSIPPGFPFNHPEVSSRHIRFAGFPHVQWKRQLCLYAAPSVEWNVNDGMFGFVDRLLLWLEKAAINQLDPTGAPLHPPVAYQTNGPGHVVVPQCDAPTVPAGGWFGLAKLRVVSPKRVDIIGWSALDATDMSGEMAAAILLDQPMPFEFPTTIRGLLDELETRGVSRELTLLALQLAASRNEEDHPLYVVIGTPMRGVRGGQTMLQHLAVWHIEPLFAWGLKKSLDRFSADDARRETGQKLDQLVREWAEAAKVGWCDVLENRPEIISSRDEGTPLAWCRDRTVSIWGCGALGATAAEWLVRAQCRKLIIWDNSQVKPGLIARQPFEESDIGAWKVDALAVRLKRIRPEVEIEPQRGNVLAGPLDADDWTGGADLVIDATASEAVFEKLEAKRKSSEVRAPIVSLVIDRKAERGLAVVAPSTYSGGPRDVTRKAKLAARDRAELHAFADAFWPDVPADQVFRPEPGCSSPTFVGSVVDVTAIAASLLNSALADLQLGESFATGHFVRQPWVPGARHEPLATALSWSPDQILQDSRMGFEIRVAYGAWADLQAWTVKSQRCAGPLVETGGILFGEQSDALHVIWVSEVLGPPPDSEASPFGFVCGVSGVATAHEEKRTRSGGSMAYVGLWHTHPRGQPLPSETDLRGMRRVVLGADTPRPRSLMVIVGGSPARPVAGAYVFARKDLEDSVARRRVHGVRRIAVAPPAARIGLALSGGGSRAIAFHLGCLRALNDRGVLDRTSVLSAVSGGSVIAAMYAYGTESFEEFDRRVVRLLRRGLLWGITRRAVASPLFLGDLFTSAVSGTAAVAADVVRTVAGVALGAFTHRPRPRRLENIQPPLRRWISRTTAFQHTLDDDLFKGLTLTSPRRRGLDVVINACELRSGSAFRFGSRESGSWRYGLLQDNQVPLSHAVAASAAYPVLLPALDREYTFVRDGAATRHRVLLTDGGVYDNLGVTCLEPGRSPEFGSNTYQVDYIICCDAGHGLFDTRPIPYWLVPRLSRAFQSVFRKAQNAAQSRLHEFAAGGDLRGFVLSYLGQQDRNLPWAPSDLVPRSVVSNYPTDFSPMSPETIAALSSRGEQLTRLLLSRYCPDL